MKRDRLSARLQGEPLSRSGPGGTFSAFYLNNGRSVASPLLCSPSYPSVALSMWTLQWHVVRRIIPSLLVLGVLSIAIGCASSEPTQSETAARAAALGTWQYQVDGIAVLNRGEFTITEKEGRLRAQIRDDRRGRFFARVQLNGSRMQLSLKDLRISGRIEDDSFTGTLRRPVWDVTSSSRMRRSSRTRSASLVAHRVSSGMPSDPKTPLDCPSILWETDDGCEEDL